MPTPPLRILPIIIFGAALGADGRPRSVLYKRVGWALRYGKQQQETPYRKVVYIPTGGPTAAEFGHTVTESTYMAGWLEEGYVKPSLILAEHRALNTMRSVKNVALLLCRLEQEFIVETPVLVSSFYHIWRCRLLMKWAGWATQYTYPPGPMASHWKKRFYWFFREVCAFIYDGCVGGFVLEPVRKKRAKKSF